MLLSLENEDDEFLDGFNRVIKDPDVAVAEGDQNSPSEDGEEDLYFDMELGIRRDDNGRTPIEYIIGDTSNVSEYTICGFYNWVTHRQNAGLGKIEIRRWLGVSHKVGKLKSYWNITGIGKCYASYKQCKE